jgi:hypothetical protein
MVDEYQCLKRSMLFPSSGIVGSFFGLYFEVLRGSQFLQVLQRSKSRPVMIMNERKEGEAKQNS